MGEFHYLTINGKTYTVADPDAATIRNDTVGADAWSAKNIVDRLCPAFKETGSHVIFQPVEGYPLEVVSQINAFQQGSDIPSPDNIRPIMGYQQECLTHGCQQYEKNYIRGFGQTVYGGSFAWHTGVLTRTHVEIVLDGTEEWAENTATQYYLRHGLSNIVSWGECICSHFRGTPQGAYNSVNGDISASGATIWVYSTLFTSVNEFKAYLAAQYAMGTPVTVILQLSEPVTTQLEAQQIPALPGENYLFGENPGSVTVTGRAAPGAVIERLTNAILALGGNI